MLKKLIFTSAIFLLITIVFGVISLRETSRMSAWQDKQGAEAIERGGIVYAQNCATCHGEHAKSELCFSTLGEQTACVSRPLNSYEFLCGEPSQRLEAVGWEGSKEEYIRAITTVGNQEKGMPAFGKAFRYDTLTAITEPQIDDVTAYLLNFETFPCDPLDKPIQEIWFKSVADLPIGDAINGKELYELTYACSACHGALNVNGSNALGPWTGNFKDLDNRRDGYTAADYAYESILLPDAHISPNCPTGSCADPSNMPGNFGMRMSIQDIADILAYVGIDSQVSNGIEITYPEN